MGQSQSQYISCQSYIKAEPAFRFGFYKIRRSLKYFFFDFLYLLEIDFLDVVSEWGCHLQHPKWHIKLKHCPNLKSIKKWTVVIRLMVRRSNFTWSKLKIKNMFISFFTRSKVFQLQSLKLVFLTRLKDLIKWPTVDLKFVKNATRSMTRLPFDMKVPRTKVFSHF
jgi:hypothetical protein